MAVFRRILIATDFSPTAAHALETGASLASAHRAEVLILHVWAVPILAFGDAVLEASPARFGRMMEEMKRKIADDEARVRARDVARVETLLVDGDPRREIVEVARDRACDLVVLGARGHGRIVPLLLGSVVEHVVRANPRPVLVVPARRDAKEMP